eukprot:214199-Prymnesium_polylepis.1
MDVVSRATRAALRRARDSGTRVRPRAAGWCAAPLGSIRRATPPFRTFPRVHPHLTSRRSGVS